MITDVESYLRFFDSLRRRTERDVAALPPAAAAWRPPAATGEAGWGIGELVGHIGATRLYFASAYRGEGWIFVTPDIDHADQVTWLPWLRSSAERFDPHRPFGRSSAARIPSPRGVLGSE